MPIVEIDERGRITIPKELRKIISAKQGQMFILRLSDRNTLILKKIEKKGKGKDPFLESIKNPIHVDPEKIKKINLEKVEEEMWSS